MTIEINQTLHGYEQGHQLLSSSIELTNEDKRILLFQSDLSGSAIDRKFKTYLTGYPIDASTTYAFSRSWYAEEMKRPGCVWTHTLLIKFSDLGKIPNLNLLLDIFKRPQINEYKSYGQKLFINLDRVLAISDKRPSFSIEKNEYVYSALYENAQKTILIPTNKPSEVEETILDLWSWQWPRLRRNFLFCTGALGLRKLSNREFDLQVIPDYLLSSIQRSSSQPYIAESSRLTKSNWTNILASYSEVDLKRFLWTFGADIPGDRANYIPLLHIFYVLNNQEVTLKRIADFLSVNFSDPHEAANIKSKIFGRNSILHNKFSEKELVIFLLSNEVKNLNEEKLDVAERLIELVQNRQIDIYELVQLWANDIASKIPERVWGMVDYTNFDAYDIWLNHENLIPVLLKTAPFLAQNRQVWNMPCHQQLLVLKTLNEELDITDIKPYVHLMLEENSSCMLEGVSYFGVKAIEISFEWLNGKKDLQSSQTILYKKLAGRHHDILHRWVILNENRLSLTTFSIIFSTFTFRDIQALHFEGKTWLNFYKNVNQNDHYLYNVASIFLLGLGLNNAVSESDKIVVETFHNVYSLAAGGKLEDSLWSIIPRDELEEEEETSLLESFLALLGISPSKKKNQIQYWDYCEILVRTFSTRFLKFGWTEQSFLSALKNEMTFTRVIGYLFSFKRGIKYLNNTRKLVLNGRINSYPFQYKMFEESIKK